MASAAGAHIYVLGEAEHPKGPVKIGLHYGASKGLVRPGLQTGNWRTLEVIGNWALPAPAARWHEYVIHHNLADHRVGSTEWFKVRQLVDARTVGSGC